MFTMDQLILHLIGDYLTQSDWMAVNKTKQSVPAAVHATVYSLPFLLLSPSMLAFAVILVTHFLIDRFRLARYVVWGKNYLAPWDVVIDRDIKTGRFVSKWAPPTPPFSECQPTGYPPGRPDWLTTWLLIIADNICHLVLNGLALWYL